MNDRELLIEQLIRLLRFDSGLANQVRKNYADTPIGELQAFVDEVRDIRKRIEKHLIEIEPFMQELRAQIKEYDMRELRAKLKES